MNKNSFYITGLCLVCLSCREEWKPSSLPPELELYEAKKITRTTAVLSGEIQRREDGMVSSCHFRYGTSPELTDAAEAAAGKTEGYTEASLTGLTAGVEYYYSIRAGNGFSSVESAPKSFRTLANSTPVLGDITLVNKGPFSATVECTITDNGGAVPTTVGFKYRAIPGGQEEFIPAETTENGSFKARLSGLDMETSYEVRGYAVNAVGEAFSNLTGFTTDNAVYISEAGTLADIIGEKQKYRLQQLSIAGRLNGTDLRLLRDMMGRDINGGETPGRLYELDLLDAFIVRGGESYYASRFTREDTLGYATFAGCGYLEKIILPRSLKVIEKDAFLDCPALTVLTIPDHTVHYVPSGGCPRLANISVSALNPYYASEEGVLYDKKKETLLQYPEGKTGLSLTIPSSVTTLADNAFQRCPLRSLEIPPGVTTLGGQVFRNSELESITLPDGIETLPTGTFQGCRQLRSLILGSGTSLVSNYCFDGCTSLRDLYIRAFLPPVCYSQAFSGSGLFNQCTLHVPANTKFTYRQHKSWKNFIHITEESMP